MQPCGSAIAPIAGRSAEYFAFRSNVRRRWVCREGKGMARLIVEIVMLLSLLGGLFFVTQVLAKEHRQELSDKKREGSEPKP